jgi:hypothetical protein
MRQTNPIIGGSQELSLKLLSSIPVTVNDCYGDPFFGAQFENTLTKLRLLRERRGPTSVITKGTLTESMLSRLTECISQNTVFVYSFTGLNEGNIGFEQRKQTLLRLHSIGARICILLRPIIPGRNDSLSVLEPILQLAAEMDAVVGYGGYKEIGSLKRMYSGFPAHKYLNPTVEKALQVRCAQLNLRTFSKSGCAVAFLTGNECFVHPKNTVPAEGSLELLHQLGFRVEFDGSSLVLESGSAGDVNFVRAISRVTPKVENLSSTSAILQFSTTSRTFENTSSYFVWSRNINKCLGCEYCCIQSFEHLWGKHNIEIGCAPEQLLELLNNEN